MKAFTLAALCVLQATYAERSFQDVLSSLGGDFIGTPPRHVAAAKSAVARNSSSSLSTPTYADDQDADDQRNFGQPCARDAECVAGRGLSCQEWVCRCAPDMPVKVRDQGVDTCLPAKSLYEACRYHQQCSHRSANMRCVDFLCYCPLPYELRGSGECLKPQQVQAKVIAAVAPATILVVIVTAIGGTFLFRRAFANAEDKEDSSNSRAFARQAQKPRSGSMVHRSEVPKTSISVRTGPLKTLRPKKPTSNIYSQSHETSSLPFTRLIRVPPDKQRPNAFSPAPVSTTTAMQTSSFTPPVPFEKFSLPLDKSALSAVFPGPLSSKRLIEKLLSSSVDLPEEEGISVRILENNRPTQHPRFPTEPKENALPLVTSEFQKRAVLPLRKCDNSHTDDGSSLPIEWGTARPKQQPHGNLVVGDQSNRHEQDVKTFDDAKDDASGRTLFSSFRQSKNVTFQDCTSSDTAEAGRKVDAEKPIDQLSNPVVRTGYEPGMRVSSLKAETRWLYQSEQPSATQRGEPTGERRLSGRSEDQRGEEPRAGAESNKAGNRTKAPEQPSLTWGERNRLGVGTPFVDIEEGPLAESASIPLSFMSPISPSFEVLPKPDITSGMLREANALLHSAEDGATTTDTQEQEDASLVAGFMAAVGIKKSSSDSTTPLQFGGTAGSGNVKEQPGVLAGDETNISTPTRPSSVGQVTAPLVQASSLPPQQTSPAVVTKVACQGNAPKAISKPPGDTDGWKDSTAGEPRQDDSKATAQAPQPNDGTSSYSDIENLAEILTSLKVTQLGNEHLRRERTFLRDSGVVAPLLPGLPVGLQWPKPAVTGSPAVVPRAGAKTTTEHIIPPSRNRAATPVSEHSSAGPPKVAATPVLPPVKESSEEASELPPSSEGSGKCLSNEFRTPVELQSESTQEYAGRDSETTETTTEVRCGRSQSVAELHRAQMSSSHLDVPRTSFSSHPVPLRRSIHFCRTSASLLQAVPETFHGAQPRPSPAPLPRKTPTLGEGERIGNTLATRATPVGPSALQSDSQQLIEGEHASCLREAEKSSSSPKSTRTEDFMEFHGAPPQVQARARAANVRSEPLRGRSPFAMRKHFSEPINPKDLQAAANKTSRKQSRSSTSACRSSDLCSVNTGSSLVAVCDKAYDTDALIPSSIPTVTATSAGEQDESSYAALSSFICRSHLLPECTLMPVLDSSSDTTRATTAEATLLSTMANGTPQPNNFGSASLLVSPPTPRRGQQRDLGNREISATANSGTLQETENLHSYGDLATTSSVPRPVPFPRKIKNILSSSIGSVTRATWGTTAPRREILTETADASVATPATEKIRSTSDDGFSKSRISKYGRKPPPRQSRTTSKRGKRSTSRSQSSSRAARKTSMGQNTGSIVTSARTPPLFSPSVAATDALASCGVHHSVASTNGNRDLHSPAERDTVRDTRSVATTVTTTTTSVLEVSSSKRKSKLARKTMAAVTKKKSSLPRFFFGRHRESEGGDDASSIPSESSGTTDGLRLSVIMAKLGILPSHRFFASSTTDTGLSLETVLPSRHGAGDRGGHSANDDTTSRPPFSQSEASSRLPRVWPESSTSFSVAETSEPDSFLVDDSCVNANATASERGTSHHLQAHRDNRERSASLTATSIRNAFRGMIVSPDPEWFSCSSRISDRPTRPF